MKKILFLIIVLVGLSAVETKAQYVRVRPNMNTRVIITAPNPAPFRGAIWIGPEWRWNRGQYESVPGYWARPHRHGAIWVPGHWKNTRRGYKWVPGHWR